MVVVNPRKGWSFPSLVTFSMTINSAVGQTMKTDFLPLVSTSLFEMGDEELESKLLMEVNAKAENGMFQSIQPLLDSWHPSGRPLISTSTKQHSLQESWGAVIQPLSKTVDEAKLNHTKAYEQILKIYLDTSVSSQQAAQEEIRAQDPVKVSLYFQSQFQESNRSWCFQKAFPRFVEPLPKPDTNGQFKTLSPVSRWSKFHVNVKSKGETPNQESFQVQPNETDSLEVPPQGQVSPCDHQATKQTFRQVEKCYEPKTECPVDPVLPLKAFILSATKTNFNPYQGCYYQKSLLNQKLCKFASQLRKVLNLNQTVHTRYFSKMDPMDLWNDVQLADMENVGDEAALLGQVALAEEANMAGGDEDPMQFGDFDDDNLGEERDEGNFYFESDGDYSEAYVDNFDEFPMPRRSPSPNTLVALLNEANRAGEMENGGQIVLDFRIAHGAGTWEELRGDLDDQAVPNAQ